MWDLSPPEVSRHLAVPRRTDLLTARRHGRCTLSLPALTALGADPTHWRAYCAERLRSLALRIGPVRRGPLL